MKTFICEEMMCDHCVSRIGEALTEAKIDHKIDLGTKTVTIEDSENRENEAVEILEDLGFSAVPA